MVSEAETRALLDYVLAHRNIAAILTFGESDNLIAAPAARPAAAAGLTPGRLRRSRQRAGARASGCCQDLGGAGGRGGRGGGMFMIGDEGGPGRARRDRPRPPGAAEAGVAACDDRERGRPRVLPRDRRRSTAS